MEKLNYYHTFERKLRDILYELATDPKKALKAINKEIETRGKKIEPIFMYNLRVVRGLCLDHNSRLEEAREEVLSVFEEVKRDNLVDQYLLETLTRTTAQMKEREFFSGQYLKLIEHLLVGHPQSQELTFTMYDGALKNNDFGVAAKMAGKMNMAFK
jgi:CRISPR/Cas system-associated endonuclease/helicase Cas3